MAAMPLRPFAPPVQRHAQERRWLLLIGHFLLYSRFRLWL